MTIAALNWPAAAVYIAVIVAAGLVVAVLLWSIFRTGRQRSEATADKNTV